MIPKTCLRLLVLTILLLATACGPEQNSNTETPAAPLAPPQVRVTAMPETTATPEVAALPVESTPTPAEAGQIQPVPTTDDQEYLLNLIDGLMDKIDNKLRDTDTELKP